MACPLTFALTAALLTLLLCIPALPQDATAPDEAGIQKRALVSMGDTARLQHALAKARRGEPVVVGVIGGSITQGAAASTEELRYGNQIAKWWRETFPQTEVRYVNAGIGATGSNYGSLRAKRDLLSKHPDFVVVEYGVNDGNTRECAETLEGLLRQILSQPNQPAVALLFTMNNAGGNAQEWQSKLGVHYKLPMVSFRDAFWPEIEAKRMKWEDIEGDEVHPNDAGHTAMAQFVDSLVGKVLAALPADADLPAIAATPAPLVGDLFEHVTLLEADALTPTANQGWSFDEAGGWNKAWVANQPGSVLEFEIEGRAVMLMEWHLRGAMGKAEVRVDDLAPTVVDGWFPGTWGGYRSCEELARDLGPGKHRVRIEIMENNNPESDGHEFRVHGLGAAGVE